MGCASHPVNSPMKQEAQIMSLRLFEYLEGSDSCFQAGHMLLELILLRVVNVKKIRFPRV